MKTIHTDVYTLYELDEKAKEKARDWYKEHDDMPFLEDAMQNALEDYLSDAKITCKNPKVFSSLAYRQGDGAMFEGSMQWKGRYIKVEHKGYYYHAYSAKIEAPDMSEREYKDFSEIYVRICKKLEKYGYDYIEEELSDERVDERILANEYTFTKEGKRFG